MTKKTVGRSGRAAEAIAERRDLRANKILSIAAKLFRERGYAGTTIEDIANRAKMNKALIYYYFENKTMLLYRIISDPLEKMTVAAQNIVASEASPREKLKGLVLNHVGWQLEHAGLTGIGHVERKNLSPKLLHEYVSRRDEYEGLFRAVIQDGIARGELSFADPKTAALLTLGLLTSITQWYKPSGRFSPAEIQALACAYVLGALSDGGADKACAG